MSTLDELVGRVAEQKSVEASIEVLVADLVERIKATSNDQNIQGLSRDLKGVRSALVRAIVGKPAKPSAG